MKANCATARVPIIHDRPENASTFFGQAGNVSRGGAPDDEAITHYDGLNRIAEFAGSGKIARHYLFGTGPNEVLAVDQGGETAWAFADQLGSVTTWGTYDGVAWSLEHQSFDAFGNLEMSTAPLLVGGMALPTVWAGHQFDAAIGLYHMQARWYDPRSGQFISLDPTRFDAGDANMYRYVGNDPSNLIDPTGESAVGKVLKKKLWKNAWKAMRRKLTERIGAGLLRVHHILTRDLYKDPQIGKWLTDTLKQSRDAKANLLALPKDKAARDALMNAGKMKTKRSIHPGKHLDDYMSRVKKEISTIRNQHLFGGLSTAEARKAVESMRSELKKGLRDGSIPLSNEDRRRLLKGALSIGGLVALSLAPQDQALAHEAMTQLQMERIEAAMKDPRLTKTGYLVASTYTGDEGLMGWVGWGVDLFNPIEDVKMLQEGGYFLIEHYSEPDWEAMSTSDILDRMDELRDKRK